MALSIPTKTVPSKVISQKVAANKAVPVWNQLAAVGQALAARPAANGQPVRPLAELVYTDNGGVVPTGVILDGGATGIVFAWADPECTEFLVSINGIAYPVPADAPACPVADPAQYASAMSQALRGVTRRHQVDRRHWMAEHDAFAVRLGNELQKEVQKATNQHLDEVEELQALHDRQLADLRDKYESRLDKENCPHRRLSSTLLATVELLSDDLPANGQELLDALVPLLQEDGPLTLDLVRGLDRFITLVCPPADA
ncbi:hypothetical protein GCM10009765_23620 [Fodinicola feengrottensis]|uniref:Uncharacterized protein n=2 Tax=Fodinicola feengrottensis TaxID=435914 RepID=A0ABN2GM92_9ACTN